MSDDFEVSCHVWDVDLQKPEDESVPFPTFEINIKARLTLAPNEEEDEPFFIVPESVLFQKTEEVRVERLLDNEDGNNNDNVVRGMLVSMGVPVQDFMLDRILAFAKHMTSNKRYLNRKVLRMHVEIEAIVEELPLPEEDDEDDDDDGGDDDEGCSSSSETATVVEKLMVKVVVERPNSCCPICTEDFLVGTEAITMPCRCSRPHLFHHGCILPWLSTKQQCPLCRSEFSI